MNTIRKFGFLTAVVVVIAGLFVPRPSLSETGPSITDTQLLRALLDEVRMLRNTVRDSNVAMVRTRILADTLVEQRRQAASLTEQVEALRVRIEVAQKDDGSDEQLAMQLRTAVDASLDAATKVKNTQDYEAFVRSVDAKKRVITEQIAADRERVHRLTGELAAAMQCIADTEKSLLSVERAFTVESR